MTYYLSGSISKQKDFEDYFLSYKNYLINQGGVKEEDIFNPAEEYEEAINYYGKSSWEVYMKWDIKFLTDCDCLVLLPNWRKSKGTKIEKWLAKKLGIRVVKYKQLVKELLEKLEKDCEWDE